jgi:uncharacterized membrane protein YfcA
MTLVLISIVALVSSLLTFFSGFGLGTLLSGVLFLFFEVEIALLITTIVHFLNNVFKFFLVKKNIELSVFYKFGFYSFLGSFFGAFMFYLLKEINPFFVYTIGDKECSVTFIKIILGLILMYFSIIEIFSKVERGADLNFDLNRWMRNGGLVSGFFGGISGHQGALRSAFMVKMKLSKESFIATGVAVACLVDLTRLPVYMMTIKMQTVVDQKNVIILATISAFLGAYIGAKNLKKITLETIQKIVGFLLFLIGLSLIIGLI